MKKFVSGLAIVVLALGAGLFGAFAYDEWIDDDSPTVSQAPLSSKTQPANDNAEDGTLTPAEIYDKTGPGVALITALVTQETQSPFGDTQEQQGESTGTGFVVSDEGFIVTNAHVVQGAKTAKVQFGEDKAIDAVVKGVDVNSDLAVLKVDPKDHDLTKLDLGSTQGLRVGDPVVAIGNPFGLDRTLTTGVVSALARRIQGLNGFSIENVVQTDAAINKGNSGGPLIDASGAVIGVNSQIQSESGGNVGIGFAVPVERLKSVLPQLERGEEVKVAFLGVTAVPLDEKQAKVVKLEEGLLVADVTKDSGADKAGIKAGDSGIMFEMAGGQVDLGGDVLLEIDGKKLTKPSELQSYVASKKVGDKVKLKYVRGADTKTVEIELGNRPTTITEP
ncbi:MAG: trypsin-like peptidase domain-containing protein [Solirubrobacteraceae bacterium]|nr:trypsin-like peptidase domain-containing protein [Solirubrobacteraceae bacterium]